MISQLLTDILSLTFEGEGQNELLKTYMEYLANQIPLLKINQLEYTGSGLFVNFHITPDMELLKESAKDFLYDDARWDSLELKNDELGILADTMVIITNGYIDYIEIWNKTGADYPIEEPQHYELRWRGGYDFEKTIKR